MSQHHEYTARQFASREGVHVRTVWRWVTKGALPIRRTPSGRIRIIQAQRLVTIGNNQSQSVK